MIQFNLFRFNRVFKENSGTLTHEFRRWAILLKKTHWIYFNAKQVKVVRPLHFTWCTASTFCVPLSCFHPFSLYENFIHSEQRPILPGIKSSVIFMVFIRFELRKLKTKKAKKFLFLAHFVDSYICQTQRNTFHAAINSFSELFSHTRFPWSNFRNALPTLHRALPRTTNLFISSFCSRTAPNRSLTSVLWWKDQQL